FGARRRTCFRDHRHGRQQCQHRKTQHQPFQSTLHDFSPSFKKSPRVPAFRKMAREVLANQTDPKISKSDKAHIAALQTYNAMGYCRQVAGQMAISENCNENSDGRLKQSNLLRKRGEGTDVGRFGRLVKKGGSGRGSASSTRRAGNSANESAAQGFALQLLEPGRK